MNNTRRKTLAEIKERADELRGLLETLRDDVDAVKDEETDARDAMPESMRDGDRGQKADAAVDALEESSSAIDSAIGELESLQGYLDTASE